MTENLAGNIQTLIEAKADVNETDCNGATALMTCCSRRDLDPLPGVILLVESGAEINKQGKDRKNIVEPLNFAINVSSEAKLKARSEASHQNISNLIFDGKLRFALLASLSNFQRNLS